MQKAKNIPVLILGGEGMLGHMVAHVLSQTGGFAVRMSTRSGRKGTVPFCVEEGEKGLRKLLSGRGKPAYVVNGIGVLACDINEQKADSVRRAVQVNAMFPRELAEVSAEGGVRILHISTDAVFAPDAGACYEDSRVTAQDVYGRTKSLGEANAPHVLNLRCSFVGPGPHKHQGLLEWLRSQPAGAEVPGYANQKWCGATTLQIAQWCRQVMQEGRFEAIRRDTGILHLCPNDPVTKSELLQYLQEAFHLDVRIRSTEQGAPAVTRFLATRHARAVCLDGTEGKLRTAIQDLAAMGIVGRQNKE